jgi:hypothetical protein
VVAAALFFLMAGMMHPQFLVFGAVVVAGSVISLLPALRRDLRAGVSPWRTMAVAVGGTFIAGAALGVGAVAAIGPAARAHVDTSRDALLRRLGLPGAIKSSYREVLRRFFPWYRVLTVAGLAATALLIPNEELQRKPGDVSGDGPQLFWGAMAGWVAVTGASVGALLAGVTSPGQRLAAFCLPLPVLAAIGLPAAGRQLGERLGTLAGRVATIAAVALFAVVAFLAWRNTEPLISSDAADQFQRAGQVLAVQPRGTPLILVANDSLAAAGLRTTRYTNYLRAAVPPSRMTDIHLFWGTPRNFLQRHPTLTGDFEHDRLARAYWKDVQGTLARNPLAVSFQSLDPHGYAQALRLGGRPIGRGIVALRGLTGSFRIPHGLPSEWTQVGSGSMSPWVPVWLAPVVLIALVALGWPVAVGLMPGSDRLVQLALAPAFAFAFLGLAGWAVDAGGIRLLHGGGIVAGLLTLAGGALNWLSQRGSRATPRRSNR